MDATSLAGRRFGLAHTVKAWDATWQAALELAIDGSQQPIYMFQNRNGGSLEPTADLSAYAFRIPHRHQGAIFHSVPAGPFPYTRNAHIDFVTVPAEVALWGPSGRAAHELGERVCSIAGSPPRTIGASPIA